MENKQLIRMLEKETPILTAQIRVLYRELDKKFHLRGAAVPITFGTERDLLGAYRRSQHGEQEHFHFSLLFIGYAVEHPLSKEDRMDLYKHEYAHYMQYNMPIPKEYTWQAGTHGSAWKYCCSLIGAAPTPYYRAGEALLKHDYKKALKNPIHDKTVTMRDNYRREQEYQNTKNRVIQYEFGEQVDLPKFGQGLVDGIEQTTGSVRLKIRFGEDVKVIDQRWLVRRKLRGRNS